MKMKRVLSLLLVGAMVMGMTACGGNAEKPKDKESGDGGDKTISILWPETDSTQVDVMENYIQPALEKEFQDIEFEYIPMTADSPVKTMSASGDLPEIFFTSGADRER